jgi:outer membrane receptor protein involved in Fe transport
MKKNLLTIVLICISVMSFSQNITLKGKVTNTKNESLGRASILALPSGKSTISEDNGNYTITFPSSEEKMSIRVTYYGYQTKETVIETNVSGDLNFVLNSDVLSLNDVVILGSSNPKSKLNSSVSVSSLKLDDISQSAARSTAEIFRSIPGIKSEASGGDGNTNITVRGIPISAGGSKFLQLQEDGLPVLQFGDIAFATADIFLRADQTLNRIEAIRGGSASTLATNSPAGIINFISKTGVNEGGSFALTSGLNYGTYRADFNYGSPIGNGLTFNVGGFYRSGEGTRTAGYSANNGGQLKMNVTKKFSKGYARLYFKHLNDRTPAYMPMPLQVTGTNGNPTYSSLPGFDAKRGTMHSPYLLQNFGLGANGERRNVDVADGMNPITTSVGAEFNLDLGNGWKFEDRTRMALNKGRFVAPFPANVGTTSAMLSTIATSKSWNLAGATLRYANDNTPFSGSNAMIIHMFDTELNNFNNFVNDMKLKKKIKTTDLTFGLYKSLQNINMSWLWNSYLTDVKGDGLRPINIINNSGRTLTQNGQFAYGVPGWGNCCQRSYNTKYDISAPYAVVSLQPTEAFSAEISMRWDISRVTGNFAGGSQSTIDVNNNGNIDSTEVSVSSINHQSLAPVNYKTNTMSYSIGGNYKLNTNTAVFARYSSGYSAKADRILFTSNILTNGDARGVTDKIDQLEIGYKSNFKNVGLFITGFYANVDEKGSYEASTQIIRENQYKSMGLEVEAAARIGKGFDIRGGLTYTNAEITNEANKGKKPRRQAPFIFNFVPSFNSKNLTIGITTIGTSDSYAQDDNKLKLKGYVMFNPFITYKFSKFINASLNANNITNVFGITESEEGSIIDNSTNIIRARSITGTTISATIGINF